MTTAITLAVAGQALGALIGVAACVWGELSYLHAARDGNIDHAERLHLNMIAHALRYGLTLLLVASFTLVVLAFMAHGTPQPAMTSSYWMLTGLMFLLIYASWARSKKKLSFPLASAIIFSAWWFVLYFSFGQIPALSLAATFVFFVVATAVFYGTLQYARMLTGGRR